MECGLKYLIWVNFNKSSSVSYLIALIDHSKMYFDYSARGLFVARMPASQVVSILDFPISKIFIGKPLENN